MDLLQWAELPSSETDLKIRLPKALKGEQEFLIAAKLWN